jgi:hypothetical protein
MKYDALLFICIDSKCLNYPPHAMPIFLEIRQHGASKQTMTANAKSHWEWGKMVSKVKFNPLCFILNKKSWPNDIIGTDRTKQVEHTWWGTGEKGTRTPCTCSIIRWLSWDGMHAQCFVCRIIDFQATGSTTGV